MTTLLKNAYTIGSENFQAWSQGFDPNGYLRVLPHPDQKIPFRDPFQDWQAGRPGNYFSSWGPEEQLNATLRMEDLAQIPIDGFGILKSGDGIIPWLNNAQTPYDRLRGYNGTVPGPMFITEPGDTLNIQLENRLQSPAMASNLHTHGLHVSPLGYGDNVIFSLEPGETWPTNIPIPENHHIGLDWYHPHLHGVTNEQVASGLTGQLWVAPPFDLPDLEKWNPKDEPMFFMALNTFGIQQVQRPGKANDPLNQDPSKAVPAGTPLEVLGQSGNDKIYELSDSVFMGYNAKPAVYDPKQPTGNASTGLFPYGGGPMAGPVENVIHTVNGQYNPTVDVTTGQWNQFYFTNMTSNTFHVIQLVKDDGTTLTSQTVDLVALDGDSSGLVPEKRKEVSQLPLLSPGQRMGIQAWFDKPGTYYVLSNGTPELLGNNASPLVGPTGFQDGHLIWGPQVLATIQVTGNPAPRDAVPEAYDIVKEQSQKTDQLIAAAENGQVDRDRAFTWYSNIGGAIVAPPQEGPDDLDFSTFQGAFTIDQQYFSLSFTDGMVPLAMPMLGTTEIWDMKNASGLSDPTLPPGVPDISLTEWHPFHIHQNGFSVLEINGVPVKDLKNAYLGGVVADTIALPPTYDPNKSPNSDNPYGTPTPGGNVSEVKMLMNFEDFPGTYVNHCHILFHEDAGMMAPVRVILNTKDTWLGLASKQNANGQVNLFRANNPQQGVTLSPYGGAFNGAIDLAIGDVNYKKQTPENKNVTDNVTDIITVQTALTNPQDKFTVKVFDGKTLIEQQEKGQQQFNGQNPELLITQLTPFQGITLSPDAKASVATGDINGDGYSDIIVGAGGSSPVIEVYSGKDYQLLTRVTPFHHEAKLTSTINLASGDVDGDNFADIIVAQGAGGQGLVEVFSGRLIDTEGSLDGKETAHKAALLSEPFQPYGSSYQGEVDLTSGYILQRPDAPNGSEVQTYHANITTMAVGNVPQGQQAMKVFTFVGGGHHEHEASDDSSEMPELRLDAEFTPKTGIQEFSGTFADIPGLSRGEPVLFTRNSSGQTELIRLQEKNIPTSINIASGLPLQTKGDDLIYGDSGENSLAGSLGNDSIYGVGSDDRIYGNQGNDMLFGGQGDDTVHGGKDDDAVLGNQGNDVVCGDLGNDTVYGGKDDDLLFGNQGKDVLYGDLGNDTVYGGKDNDLVFGNQGQDVLYGDVGNDTVYGGQDNDLLFGGQGQDVLYGDQGDDSLYGGKDNDTLIGGAGNDWLNGDQGDDVLVGGGGSDRFILSSNTATDTIVDFENGKDLLVLTNGLKFSQLSITQGNSGTSISIGNTGLVLAILNDVQANLIGAEDFVS